MREIKFRGKRVDNGEWVYGYLVKQFGTFKIYDDSKEDFGNWIYEVDPETIGQHTGLKVKTGEVFEGDIGKSIDGIFLVAWDEEKAAFVMRFYDYPEETLYLEEMWDDAEIIGNIYENPELLEGTK